ncbi:MAG: hypothetical protein ACREYC_15575 [Gammaproteobacteria bacterium]
MSVAAWAGAGAGRLDACADLAIGRLARAVNNPRSGALLTRPWGPSFQDQLPLSRFAPGKTVGARTP